MNDASNVTDWCMAEGNGRPKRVVLAVSLF
jgi:hypothetical protein